MPARKIKVEIFDGSGNRYTVTFEGQVTRDKAIRLLDLVELLGGMPGLNPELGRATSEFSKFDKLRLIVERHFPIVWFSSKDIRSVYEQKLKEPISLSTVSTYLARMADRGILAKSGAPNNQRYRMMTEITKAVALPVKP